jgi:hypothetical protein
VTLSGLRLCETNIKFLCPVVCNGPFSYFFCHSHYFMSSSQCCSVVITFSAFYPQACLLLWVTSRNPWEVTYHSEISNTSNIKIHHFTRSWARCIHLRSSQPPPVRPILASRLIFGLPRWSFLIDPHQYSVCVPCLSPILSLPHANFIILFILIVNSFYGMRCVFVKLGENNIWTQYGWN